MGKGTIYKIENLVNGKVYIGQTKQKFKTRKSSHLLSLRKNIHHNDHLQKAWNKHGEKNFTIEEIIECDVCELDEWEMFYISFYDSCNRKFGYNYEGGGVLCKKVHQETRVKMSNHIKTLWEQEWFQEVRQKKVICINSGEVFNSLKEVAEKLGVDRPNISSCCLGLRDFATGKNGVKYQFSYFEEGQEYKLKPLEYRPRRKRAVICLNNLMVFKTLKEASEYFNVPYQSVVQVVRESAKCAFSKEGVGYHFAYYDEGTEYHKKNTKMEPDNSPKKVICLTTEKIFDSLSDAAKEYGIARGYHISRVCNGMRKYCGKLPDGTQLKWAYYDCQ